MKSASSWARASRSWTFSPAISRRNTSTSTRTTAHKRAAQDHDCAAKHRGPALLSYADTGYLSQLPCAQVHTMVRLAWHFTRSCRRRLGGHLFRIIHAYRDHSGTRRFAGCVSRALGEGKRADRKSTRLNSSHTH